MPNWCAVQNCPGTNGCTFPKDPELRRQWIAAVGRTALWEPRGARVCHAHFKPDDYKVPVQSMVGLGARVRKDLKSGVVPSIFTKCESTPVIMGECTETPMQGTRSIDYNPGVVGGHNCAHCEKVFKSKRSLYGHVKEMHSGKSETHSCPECGKEFSRKTNLNAHLKDMHWGTSEIHPCPECGKEYSKRTSLNSHMRNTHSVTFGALGRCSDRVGDPKDKEFIADSPPLMPEVDMEEFPEVANDVETMAGVQRPYQCPTCSAILNTFSEVQSHVHEVHSYEEEIYLCRLCHLSTTTREAWLSHYSKCSRYRTNRRGYNTDLLNINFLLIYFQFQECILP